MKEADAVMIGTYAKLAGVPHATGRRRVRVMVFGWINGRLPDPDAYHKSVHDALVKLQLLVDDSQKYLLMTPSEAARSPNKRTVIVIEEVPDDPRESSESVSVSGDAGETQGCDSRAQGTAPTQCLESGGSRTVQESGGDRPDSAGASSC